MGPARRVIAITHVDEPLLFFWRIRRGDQVQRACEKVRELRSITPVVLCCALLFAGCRGDGDALCPSPELSAEPQTIPDGVAETRVYVRVEGFSGFEAQTMLTAESGAFADPRASETTFACAHDVTGPVEICVDAEYTKADESSEGAEIDATASYVRRPHAYLPDPATCSETKCIEVICPENGNTCPVVSTLTVEPEVLEAGETATITVAATDPDSSPDRLVTAFTARHGTISNASETRAHYTCDPEVGGIVEICVTASDGDTNCDVERCTSVRCPGEPLENTCPIIESVSANPVEIPDGQFQTLVSVEASDPDDYPVPLRNEWTAGSGVFADRFADETVFTCGASGPVQICVRANDGDPSCSSPRCLTVQCPGNIRANFCPELFVINSIPRTIPAGQTSTRVETRAQDTDRIPSPVTLTLNSLWGSFENTENLQEPFDVVAQNAIYNCDRPGIVEVCVDATDGACTKTLCDTIICPDDVPTAP